jgi:hypothetical protein
MVVNIRPGRYKWVFFFHRQLPRFSTVSICASAEADDAVLAYFPLVALVNGAFALGERCCVAE